MLFWLLILAHSLRDFFCLSSVGRAFWCVIPRQSCWPILTCMIRGSDLAVRNCRLSLLTAVSSKG